MAGAMNPRTPPPGPGRPPDDAIALRVYEICVSRGYVDGRDWAEVARQTASRATDAPRVTSGPPLPGRHAA